MIDILIEILKSTFGAARGPDAAKRPRAATAGRILAGAAAVVFSFYALFVLRQLAVGFGRDVLGVLFAFYGVSGATICWWFALWGHDPESRRRFTSSMHWGRIVGGIGLAAGILGPALLQPDANQGPLLGVLFTGPLGFVLGALFGWSRAFFDAGRSDA